MTTEVEKKTTEVVESEYFTKEDYEAWGGPAVYWGRVAESDLCCIVSTEELPTKEPFVPHFYRCAVSDSTLFNGELPDWPSDDAQNDTNRFLREWQATDWIHIYLELLLCANDRASVQLRPDFMSDLQILKVAIATDIGDMKPPNERINADCANVYVTFKGLETVPRIDEIGKHVERKAIVRRVISPGFVTLVGKHWSGKNTEKRSMTRKRYRFG